ncbi:Phospholipase D1 [Spathaspora sp. JA1]|nr:Phospholipase D1 [Spathaspora sp. JA1]
MSEVNGSNSTHQNGTSKDKPSNFLELPHDKNGFKSEEEDENKTQHFDNQELNIPKHRKSSSRSPIRESTDITRIFRSVTRDSPGDEIRSRRSRSLSEHREPPPGMLSKVYRSITRDSADVSPSRHSRSLSDESPHVISNPWSFFNSKNADKNESRYRTDEEEQQQALRTSIPEILASPVSLPGENEQSSSPLEEHFHRRESRIPFTHSQSFQNFLPTMFSGRTQETSAFNHNSMSNPQDLFHLTPDLNKQQKFKKKFSIFNRGRKFREKRRASLFDADYIDELREESEKKTGERAQRLIGTLALGGPAIQLMGSCLLEDEQGISRAPILLSLIGLKITDISLNEMTRIRKFKIDLDYGVGPQRMKWSIERNVRDLLYLHSKFKFENWIGNKNTELPKFPKPPFKKSDVMKLKKTRTQNHPELAIPPPPPTSEGEQNGTVTGTTGLNFDLTSLLSFNTLARPRSQSSVSSVSSIEEQLSPFEVNTRRNIKYVKDIEEYLKELIRIVSLKPQSNRLFMFFEISPISSLLSYETGYNGKQGIVHISGTAKSQGWRVGHLNANDIKRMIDRRSEKWMLVRNSYVMYVSDINSTSPLEVFLVDSKFKITYKHDEALKEDNESEFDDSSIVQRKMALLEDTDHSNIVFPHLKITLENSERKLVMNPKSSKEQKLWIHSLKEMQNSTIWSEKHRFGSFAPVRENCFAQWLVDGRDHFWAVSSALEMAKDTIFLHDWWLTPEIYLRRPANGNQQWRLDRILQRKAKQGVKIYVIIYRNVGGTVSIDSLYSKHSLLSLNDENIHVIRSPNQLLQNTYFWAHHEKLCIIDQTVAFVGGIDLCYGRYDTPDHTLVDDSKIDFQSLGPEDQPTNEDIVNFQTFPGKDYSNPRVKDFFELNKPYESMLDRNVTPRMPWHDVHMFTAGKLARDLSRHFVQRWNYLLRQKRPSRLTPLLTPPPDISDEEALMYGLDGTCEVQMLRSGGNWSLGLKEHEQSIHTAYLKLIESSEHFVYIENQFFVTSCLIEGTEIQNRIGDALVDRIIRAHEENTIWKAIIVIPLMPGFESQVDQAEGSSVRVIMQCQYMSISRGETSIFAKLRKKGINPDDYIQFFSLRKWGRIGVNRTLVTEQLYIHAKLMIVDDRAAIIGSANINERSMRGVRDSEVAIMVRDKEMISSSMNGEPFLAGKFAHTLRMRLMREHLGIDVDILEVVERRFKKFEQHARSLTDSTYATNKFANIENRYLSSMVEIASRDVLNEPEGTRRWRNYSVASGSSSSKNTKFELDEEDEDDDQFELAPPPMFLPISLNNRTGPHEANKGIRDKKKHSYDNRVQNNLGHKQDVYGDGIDKYKSKLAKRARLNSSRFLKDLSIQYIKNNSTGVSSFLPDIDNVVEFLESDDMNMTDEMDEESEAIISERNKERWLLLKRIAYLQRVASKEQKTNEVENKKRVNAGLSNNTSATDSSDLHNQISPESDRISAEVGANSANNNNPNISVYKKYPIVSLDENSVKDLVKSITTPEANVCKFIDPYGFEDPLDDDFYDFIWNEHARRNTDIFRMIFHSQPDDMVNRWSDYTHFTSLSSTFMKAQDVSADLRHAGSQENPEEVEEIVDIDEGIENNNDKDEDLGLLGKVPPGKDESVNPINPESKMRIRLGKRASVTVQPAENGATSPPISAEQIGEVQEENFDPTTKQIDESRSESPNEEEPELFSGEKSPPPNTTSATTTGTGNITATSSKSPPPPLQKQSATSSKTRRTRRNRAGTRAKMHSGEVIYERDTAERLLSEIQGHLVYFPTEWLNIELDNNNWFYNTDRLPPMEIYD